MKLYLLRQHTNMGYDTFDSVVVAAPDETTAQQIGPHGKTDWDSGAWVPAAYLVAVEYLGEAKPGTEQGVILASFNAG